MTKDPRKARDWYIFRKGQGEKRVDKGCATTHESKAWAIKCKATWKEKKKNEGRVTHSWSLVEETGDEKGGGDLAIYGKVKRASCQNRLLCRQRGFSKSKEKKEDEIRCLFIRDEVLKGHPRVLQALSFEFSPLWWCTEVTTQLVKTHVAAWHRSKQ